VPCFLGKRGSAAPDAGEASFACSLCASNDTLLLPVVTGDQVGDAFSTTRNADTIDGAMRRFVPTGCLHFLDRFLSQYLGRRLSTSKFGCAAFLRFTRGRGLPLVSDLGRPVLRFLLKTTGSAVFLSTITGNQVGRAHLVLGG